MIAGDAAFLANDIRVKKGLDGLGCLGDMGWYCVRASLWAYSFEKPVSVSAHAGALPSAKSVYQSNINTVLQVCHVTTNVTVQFVAQPSRPLFLSRLLSRTQVAQCNKS